MRIMDCVLLLFQKKIDPVTMDPEKPCCKPSWGESLKVRRTLVSLVRCSRYPRTWRISPASWQVAANCHIFKSLASTSPYSVFSLSPSFSAHENKFIKWKGLFWLTVLFQAITGLGTLGLWQGRSHLVFEAHGRGSYLAGAGSKGRKRKDGVLVPPFRV